jgi:hypothetical protein
MKAHWVVSLLALLLLFGCSKQVNRISEGSSKIDPLDAVSDVSGQLIAFSSAGGQNNSRGLFLFDRSTKNIRRLTEGQESGSMVLAGDHSSVFWTAVDKSSPVASQFDLKGNLNSVLRFPKNMDGKPPRWCSASTQILVCADDYTGLSEDSPDYNPLGFTAITIMDFQARKSSQFRVALPAHHFFYEATKARVMVSRELNENASDGLVTSYSLDGKVLSRFRQKGTNYSAHGQFYVPQLHEGALPWEIYDAKDHKILSSFNHFKNEAEFYDYFMSWNPRRDNLVLISRAYNSAENENRNHVFVFDPKARKVVREFPGSTQIVSWNADGTQLLLFKNGEFTFEPVLVN